MSLTMKDVMTANCAISNAEMLTSNHCAALAREPNKLLAAPVPPAGGSLKCWNCKADFTLSERANCDGCCWKCGNEIDLDDYVTRLQAEIAALQQRLNVADEENDELKGENDTLQHHVIDLKLANSDLQSQLTKAQEFSGLSAEALSVMQGMVEHCINIRACMGMDEGFKDFDTEEEHDFVKELRVFLAHQSAPDAKGECSQTLWLKGWGAPRTCEICGMGPCTVDAVAKGGSDE